MTFPKDTHVSVTHQGWHFTAVVQDSRVQGRARGVIVADPGTSPFTPGRFISVPVASLTVREPEPDRKAEAANLAAQVLGQYGFTAQDIAEGIAEGGSIKVTFTEPVLSDACGMGLADFCRLCRNGSCSCECHGSRS